MQVCRIDVIRFFNDSPLNYGLSVGQNGCEWKQDGTIWDSKSRNFFKNCYGITMSMHGCLSQTGDIMNVYRIIED